MNTRKEYHRKYYLANRERLLENAKEYYSEHTDKQNANKRCRYRTHSDYRKQVCERSRELQRIYRQRRKDNA